MWGGGGLRQKEENSRGGDCENSIQDYLCNWNLKVFHDAKLLGKATCICALVHVLHRCETASCCLKFGFGIKSNPILALNPVKPGHDKLERLFRVFTDLHKSSLYLSHSHVRFSLCGRLYK